jgi:cytoskeletal protein RodZ
VAGEILKKRREELGVEIKEVSDILKISSEYLSAIENDMFDKLPVAVYTIGYIRCYAKYLEVDAGPVIANFTSHLASPKPSTIIPVSSSRRNAPFYVYAIFFLLVGLLAFAVYIYTGENRTEGLKTEKIKAPVKVENTIPAVPSATNSVPVTMPELRNPEENQINESVPAVVEKEEHQLEITATDTVWLRIGFENGKFEEVLLKAGTPKSWEFEGPAQLKIGNAGGVTLKFDGKDLGVPGNPGQVLDLKFPPS